MAGNGGTKPLQARFTAFYNRGTQKYELEQTLQPDEQMWIDIGKLIREHVPDKNGNVLPSDLTSGSYQLSDLTNKGVGNVFEGKIIFDKTYGHVTYGCGSCCGYRPAYLWYDPLSIPFRAGTQNGVDAYDTCAGAPDDISSVFEGTWATTNPAIATVNATTGFHTGVGLGTTSSSAWASIQRYLKPTSCPVQRQQPTGNDNVMPSVTIDSFVPRPIPTGSTATVHVTINPSATITLTISSNGTGQATFDTGGNTTSTQMTISQTGNIYIRGNAASQAGSGDLTLAATYAGTTAASMPFSVGTTGACTGVYASHTGDGLKTCPSTIQLTDTYTISNYCNSCQFTCTPHTFDSTFVPGQCAAQVSSGVAGSSTQNVNMLQSGRFQGTDCIWH